MLSKYFKNEYVDNFFLKNYVFKIYKKKIININIVKITTKTCAIHGSKSNPIGCGSVVNVCLQ